MALETSSSLTEPRLRFDEANLQRYLFDKLPHLANQGASLKVYQFSHGQSNPTYMIKVGSQQLVLRKKPPGRFCSLLMCPCLVYLASLTTRFYPIQARSWHQLMRWRESLQFWTHFPGHQSQCQGPWYCVRTPV